MDISSWKKYFLPSCLGKGTSSLFPLGEEQEPAGMCSSPSHYSSSWPLQVEGWAGSRTSEPCHPRSDATDSELMEEVTAGNLGDNTSDLWWISDCASGVFLHVLFRENAKWDKNQHQVGFHASLPAVSGGGNLHSQVLFLELGSETAFCPKLTWMGTMKRTQAFSHRQIPSPLPTSCVTLGKWPAFSEPVFWFINDNNTYLIGLLWGLKWENDVKHLAQSMK